MPRPLVAGKPELFDDGGDRAHQSDRSEEIEGLLSGPLPLWLLAHEAFLAQTAPIADETREGITFSNLDQPLFDDAGATKRDFVDYLDRMSDRILPVLRDRALSVIRARPGGENFMQKNLPKHAPDFIRTVTMWAESSQRKVTYAVCDDRPTLLWFANQRAVEFHPALTTIEHPDRVTHLVIDLDPPVGSDFRVVVDAARAVRSALDDSGLQGAVKTSGSKGLHVFVPISADLSPEDAAAITRALAARTVALDPHVTTTAFLKEDREGKVFVDATRVGGSTVVAAYSPRIRPGVPVSFPVSWDDLPDISPADFTIFSAPDLLADRDPWSAAMPPVQQPSDDLLAEGHDIPVARVAAMHEGKRRKRARGE